MSGPGWETASAPVPQVGPPAAAPLPGGPARAGRLRLLSRILIAYGVVALVGAIVAALLLVLAFGRVTALTDQLSSNAGGASAVLDRTATALEDAGTTAASFATTLDSGSSALLGATDDMRQIVPRLRDLESAANAVTIIGAQPLGRLATLFGEIATNLTDVTSQLDQVSKSLVGNRSSLEANARSLQALGDQVRTLAGQLSGDQLGAAIDSIRWLILALLIVATIGAGVPAVGALVTGWWLRGWLARTRRRRLGRTAAPRLAEVARRADRPSRAPVPAYSVRRAGSASGWTAQPDPRHGRMHGPRDRLQDVSLQPVELDRGAQPIGEEGDGPICVHRRPVEPAVDGPLDGSSERLEDRRDDQGRCHDGQVVRLGERREQRLRHQTTATNRAAIAAVTST